VILGPRSGQAASNSSPRRRAGSEISLFQPRPAEKKGKPAHLSGLSPIFFAQPRTTQKISRPQARNDPDRFLSRQKVNCRKAAREAALGHVRDKNTSHAANVCAYGACAAAACNPKSKKAAFAAFFEVLY